MKSFDGVIQFFRKPGILKNNTSKIRFFTVVVVTNQYESLLTNTEYISLLVNVYINDRMK